MSNKIGKIVVAIILIVIISCVVYFKIKHGTTFLKEKDKDLPYFASKISDISQVQNEIQENERIVMVNEKLYYDTGKDTTLELRCGMMDGKITSNVNPSEVLKENNQSNFKGDYGYQYGKENTIEVNINDKWYVFETKEENNIKYNDINENNNNTKTGKFIKTYNVLNIAESNDEKYLYLTIRQFQCEEIENVKVQRSLANTVKANKDYGFEFEYTDKKVEDNIKSIFENATLLSIKETDKQGLDQIQDIIKYI